LCPIHIQEKLQNGSCAILDRIFSDAQIELGNVLPPSAHGGLRYNLTICVFRSNVAFLVVNYLFVLLVLCCISDELQ